MILRLKLREFKLLLPRIAQTKQSTPCLTLLEGFFQIHNWSFINNLVKPG